jgi:S1-C subfamily serine protease
LPIIGGTVLLLLAGLASAAPLTAEQVDDVVRTAAREAQRVIVAVNTPGLASRMNALRRAEGLDVLVRDIGASDPNRRWTSWQYTRHVTCMLVLRTGARGVEVEVVGECGGARSAAEDPDGLAGAVDERAPTPDVVVPDGCATLTVANLVIEDEVGAAVAVSTETLRLRLLAFLRADGFPTRGGESVVFDQDESRDARFAIGGRVREFTRRGEAGWELAVEWEVLDRYDDVVRYRVLTRGLSKTSGREAAFSGAIQDALRRLVTRERFVALLADPAPTRDELPAAEWEAPLEVRACETRVPALPGGLEQASGAVVRVQTRDGAGSGVTISPDGFILTAAHVVEDAEEVEVVLYGGQSGAARTVRADHAQDVAIIALPGGGYPCLRLAAERPGLGADVFAIGSPLGSDLDFSVSRGIVSGFRTFGNTRFIQTDASMNAGNSGGPLLGSDGSVLGVVSWKIAAAGFEGLGFGVPGEAITERLGLVVGPRSSPDPAALAGVVGRARRSGELFEDAADPVVRAVYTAPQYSTAAGGQGFRQQRTQRVAFAVTATALTGVGAGLVGRTTHVARSEPGFDDAQWTSLVVGNSIGWALLAVGPTLYLGVL